MATAQVLAMRFRTGFGCLHERATSAFCSSRKEEFEHCHKPTAFTRKLGVTKARVDQVDYNGRFVAFSAPRCELSCIEYLE